MGPTVGTCVCDVSGSTVGCNVGILVGVFVVKITGGNVVAIVGGFVSAITAVGVEVGNLVG